MRIEVCYDIDTIKAILCHPAIYPVISSDLAPNPEDYTPNMSGTVYLAGFVDDKVIGIMVYHECTDVALWCHIQVLPEYRKQYAAQFCNDAVDWAFAFLGATKIVAQIPVIYENVIQFAERCGFVREGINRKSHLKNGELVDQIYVGKVR